MGHIRLESVVKTYGDFTALKQVDLEVEEGEFVVLLGPSGCGKTTLLRSIAGLETIQGGAIYIGDKLVSNNKFTMAPEQRNLGFIFQSYALWPHMKVFGNVAYSLRIRGWKRSDIQERVHEVLELVGLGGLHDRYPSELSGGQMQRVAVARSLASEPMVLLFDEPLSNLDAKLREKMRFELRQIQRRVGTTAVYVTHDQSEAMVISDRIVLLNQGEVVQIGSGRDLYEEPSSAFAAEFLGITNFVPARLEGDPDDAGRSILALPGDVKLRGVLSTRLRGVRDVLVAIRPEHIELYPAEGYSPVSLEEGEPVAGVIEDVVYAGNLGDVFVRVGETTLRAQVFASTLDWLDEGTEVMVRVPPRHVRAVGERSEAIRELERLRERQSANLASPLATGVDGAPPDGAPVIGAH